MPRKARKEVHLELKVVFQSPDHESALQRVGRMISNYQERFPALASWLEETTHELLAVFMLPREHQVRRRTTNGLEHYHEEVKRRTRVVRIFPNRESCLRLISALAMEQSEEWLSGRRYLRMEHWKKCLSQCSDLKQSFQRSYRHS